MSIFQVVAEKLGEFGFYNFFLPWLLTLAVIWGLLKKSNLFESPGVNAVVSLSSSTLVWGFLVGVTGADISVPLTTFITQISLLIIGMLFVVLGSALFYPKVFDVIGELMKSGSMVTIFIVAVVILALISGMFKVIFTGFGGVGKTTLGLTLMIGLFIIFMIIVGTIKET
ncbi:hypothetical protein A3K63_01320 [Candidatus Micrarchaeota archaeon RBG_16_49_10]|nr:MAG: hypothetical protein A3K63_01320 [Candidatus Micrarchaeota archaeon RBG_16_49_10]